MEMSKRRTIVLLAIVVALLGVVGDVAMSSQGFDPRGHWSRSWPQALDCWRDHAGTYHMWLSHIYNVAFQQRDVFEKGWDALLQVKCAEDAELTLISGPLWNPLPKLSKTKTPSPPALQLFTKFLKPKEGQSTSEEVIWKMTLAVDGRVIDLNRIRIPSGIKIVDRRTLPAKTDGSASADKVFTPRNLTEHASRHFKDFHDSGDTRKLYESKVPTTVEVMSGREIEDFIDRHDKARTEESRKAGGSAKHTSTFHDFTGDAT
jgi:hypothetical protein